MALRSACEHNMFCSSIIYYCYFRSLMPMHAFKHFCWYACYTQVLYWKIQCRHSVGMPACMLYTGIMLVCIQYSYSIGIYIVHRFYWNNHCKGILLILCRHSNKMRIVKVFCCYLYCVSMSVVKTLVGDLIKNDIYWGIL